MKRLTLALAFTLFAVLPARAQFTNVAGTVIDPNGIPYAGSTIKAQLVTPGGTVGGQPTVTGTCHTADRSYSCQIPVDQSPPAIVLNATGSFAMQFADNNLITPAGTQWLFTVTTTDTQGIDHGVTPPLGFGPVSFTTPITITGGFQNVSTNLSAASLPLSRVFSGGGPGAAPRLDQIPDPNQSKQFNLGATGPTTLSFIHGAVDLSGTTLALPNCVGAVATAIAQICVDLANSNDHLWNGTDNVVALLPAATSFPDGDVLGASITGANEVLQDLGGVNQTSGTSFLKINMTSPIDGDIPCVDTVVSDPLWNNCTPGTISTAILGATTTFLVTLIDNQTIVEHDSAGSASVTVTLPTADTLGLPAFGFIYSNHSAHADSIVTTTWTINGGASLPVAANTFCRLYVDENSATNWLGDCATTGGGSTTSIVGSISTKTTNYTTTATDFTILCDATAGAVTITLSSAAAAAGQVYNVKKIDSSGNACSATPSTGTIDGVASKSTTTQYTSFQVQFGGTNWSIL